MDLYFLSGNATFTTTSSSSSTASTASSVAPSTTATGPVHVPTVGSYQWIGCYTDQIGNRALTALTETNHQTMTVEICASFCSAYVLFGVEYSTFSFRLLSIVANYFQVVNATVEIISKEGARWLQQQIVICSAMVIHTSTVEDPTD